MIADRYPPTSMLLHWLTVLLILAAFALGVSMTRAPEGWGDTLYRLHWSCGATVLFLTVLRVINRVVAGVPVPYAGLTRIEAVLSKAVHHALYVLLFVVPILGWLGKSAHGGDITIFGLFNLPPLIGQDEVLSKRLLGVHKITVMLLVLTAGLHVAGALNHALIKRDGVLARMLPGWKGGRS